MECHSVAKCNQSDAIIHGPVLRQNYKVLFLCTRIHSDLFCVHQIILCCLHHKVADDKKFKGRRPLLNFDNILRIRQGGAQSNFIIMIS